MSVKFCKSVRIILANESQEIFCLMSELIEIGTDGKMTIQHNEPPYWRPGSA